MRVLIIILTITALACSCSQEKPDPLVWVNGGVFRNTRSSYYGKNITVPGFFIGKYEVTQKEWIDIMENNPSSFKGDDLPVENVSWYDCVDYCNKKSIKEGFKPYYNIDKDHKDPNNTNDIDTIKWTVTINKDADGYRLPAEVEWEYAAGGGQMSKNDRFSGSNNIEDVGWYWKNAGDKYLTGAWSWGLLVENNNSTKPVGSKQPNELGLYDMSGNVREWCWDAQAGNGAEEPGGRIWKGGGWMGADFCCEPSFRASHEANGKGPDQGFRLCRSAQSPRRAL